MERATRELIASGPAQRALKARDKAPDFTLPDPNGRAVSSAALLADGSADRVVLPRRVVPLLQPGVAGAPGSATEIPRVRRQCRRNLRRPHRTTASRCVRMRILVGSLAVGPLVVPPRPGENAQRKYLRAQRFQATAEKDSPANTQTARCAGCLTFIFTEQLSEFHDDEIATAPERRVAMCLPK